MLRLKQAEFCLQLHCLSFPISSALAHLTHSKVIKLHIVFAVTLLLCCMLSSIRHMYMRLMVVLVTVSAAIMLMSHHLPAISSRCVCLLLG